MINNLDNYDYISFDMYDTLILRNCDSPSSIFELIELIYNKKNKKINNFKSNRIYCENIARKLSNNKEITLNQIYKELEKYYSKSVCNKLKEIELETEINLSCRNNYMIDILNYVKSINKKIVITSDMYLPIDTIKKILEKNGINYDYLYLSSNVGYTKASGKLYSYILSELNILPSKIFHIGDNFKSDFVNPKKYKISSYFYKSKHKNRNIHRSIIDIFIENTIDVNKINSYKLGYKCFGPLLLGFSKWLYDNTQSKNKQKLFFLSRDGYIMKKAFDILYPNVETMYMYASRRSIIVPSLCECKDLEEMTSKFFIGKSISYKKLFKKFGLEDNVIDKTFTKINVEPERIIKTSDICKDKNIIEIYNKHKKDIISNSMFENKCLSKYLENIKFNSNSIIIDIGWFGNMQKSLCALLNSDSIQGYYFGINPKSINYPNLKMNGYLFSSKFNNNIYKSIKSANGLFEMFFLNHHGSVKRFDNSSNIVELYDYEYQNNEYSNIIFSFQQGAIDFIKSINSNNLLDYLDYNEMEYFKNMKEIIDNPSLDIVKIFGDIPVFDDEIYYIAKPKCLIKYIFNPHKFIYDFKNSVWRRAFLIRLFKSRIIGNLFYNVITTLIRR